MFARTGTGEVTGEVYGFMDVTLGCRGCMCLAACSCLSPRVAESCRLCGSVVSRVGIDTRDRVRETCRRGTGREMRVETSESRDVIAIEGQQ